MKSPVLMVALMVMTLSGGLNFVSAFAMHDSTLDVNTWIASNNSTQLQTTDLNKGPVSPTTSTAANTAQETTGPSVVTSNGDDGGNGGDATSDEEGDDVDNEEEEEGDEDGDSDNEEED
jgi:hypothetical protein